MRRRVVVGQFATRTPSQAAAQTMLYDIRHLRHKRYKIPGNSMTVSATSRERSEPLDRMGDYGENMLSELLGLDEDASSVFSCQGGSLLLSEDSLSSQNINLAMGANIVSVRSVSRALAILECFDEDTPSLALHQISAKLGLAKSTTYRLVSTLIEAGYLVQKESSEYCLSLQLLRLAGVVTSSLDIAKISRGELLSVAAQCGETVEISMLVGNQRVCIDVVESASRLKSIVQVGETFGLYHGATGLTFLAFMPQEVRSPLIRRAPLEIRNRKNDFVAELDEIRRRGFAHTIGQRVVGAAAISAPIRDMRKEVSYCMTITGPAARIAGRETEFAELLTKACQQVSSMLGATP